MKKMLCLILAMVMALSMVGCANNDENNKVIQVKVDEASALFDQLISWYSDNGYLEGDLQAETQPVVDQLQAQFDEIIAKHQKNLDAGGYDDDAKEQMIKAMDTLIGVYKTGIEEQKALPAANAVDATAELDVLKAKYNELAEIVTEAQTQATANGWDADETFITELNATFDYLNNVANDISNPDTMDAEYMVTLAADLDAMIPVWQGYLAQVSEAYVAQ